MGTLATKLTKTFGFAMRTNFFSLWSTDCFPFAHSMLNLSFEKSINFVFLWVAKCDSKSANTQWHCFYAFSKHRSNDSIKLRAVRFCSVFFSKLKHPVSLWTVLLNVPFFSRLHFHEDFKYYLTGWYGWYSIKRCDCKKVQMVEKFFKWYFHRVVLSAARRLLKYPLEW